MLQTVILGPHIDLHPGIHGSLKQDPPHGISFYQRGGRHTYLLAEGCPGDEHLTPWDEPHLGEWIDFGPGPQVVHSARWPVLQRRAWVADMDDFGYPLLLGRYAITASLRSPERLWSDEMVEAVRARAANMLLAYGHPSCKGILFRTRYALNTARSWLHRLKLMEEGRGFLDKARVVYPAQRPALAGSLAVKWSRPTPLSVLFIGNDYTAKNGRLALRIFQRLRRPDAEFTYVGQVPDEDLELTEGIDFRGPLPRKEVLALLRRAHVLFHPSRAESFGMVLLEAAAHGLAVIAGSGRGLEHIEELFDERGALLVDRNTVTPEEEEDRFAEHLTTLLDQPAEAHRMGLTNYRSVTEGSLSLARRNEILGSLYRDGESHPADQPVAFDSMPFADLPRLHLKSDEVSAAQRDFLAGNCDDRLSFYIESRGFPQRVAASSSA